MPPEDGSDIVYDESGRVVSGGSSNRRKKPSPAPKTPVQLSVPKLTKLANQMIGLTVEQASKVVADTGHVVKVDYLDPSQSAPAIFRFNHVKAYVENGLVVDAEPG